VEITGPLDTKNKGSLELVLIPEETIRKRVAELGHEISMAYRDLSPVLVGVLKGSFVFLADLIRRIDIPVTMDFVMAKSYTAARRASNVTIMRDLSLDITGRNVLLVDDIVDTGHTMQHLTGLLRAKNPASLELCTLLDKKNSRLPGEELKYVGFRIPDVYVVGYGLDYRGGFRNLPYIGVYSDTDV